MKRLTLALLLGSVFTFACGQRLVDLTPDDGTPGPQQQTPVLTGILPQRGPVEGGTSVVLTGTNLDGATEVSFGSGSATFNVDSSTQITAISPPGTSSVNVSVVTPGGRSNGLPFAYGNAPVVTGIAPAFGLVTGGQAVTVTGSAFTGASSVTFGGTAATSFTVSSDSQITAVAPAHAAGTVQLVVTTDIAASNGFDFTYGQTPTLASIAPSVGPTTGGTVVTLTGNHLTGATQVTFDTTVVTAITVVDDTHVSVATPAHAAGDVSVTITTRFGTSTGTTFTYGLPPTLTSATPPVSPTGGGTNVVLVGTALTGATAVSFGSVAATSFSVVSDTEIDAVAPAGTASVNITVTTPYGTSNGLAFGYGDAPVQTSLTPNIGLVGGGTSVVITGVQLTGATAVTFDAVAATSFTIDSDTQITATSPAHAAGAVQVVTTNASGSSNALTFTYGATPTLTTAVPNAGPTTGGTSVVLTGTDFTGATAVAFDSTAAASFTVDSPTQITAVSPAGAAGAASITVTTAYGTSNGVTFTFGVTPALTSLAPASGDVGGGTSVVITGTALDNATGVFFDATAATSFTIDSPTQITAVSPAGAGAVNVTVTSAFGTSNGLAFGYGNAPTITTLTPNTGLIAGGDTVTIDGTNFTATSTVLFASASVTVTFVSATQLTVVAPAHTAGAVNVTVTSEFGTSNAATYTYGEAPTVSGISPTAGPSAGGTSVTISGTGFTGTSAVTFAGAPATFSVVSDTTITATTPAGSAGAVVVGVTTPFGTATTSFTYVDPPTITTVTPSSGTTAGGTSVTIAGTNLSTASSVTFDGAPAIVVSVTNTALSVTTPAHAAGSADVVVITAGGSATAINGYTYEVPVPPTVTAVTPASGLIAGGTTVTITGTGFTGATGVTFDALAASALTVVSDTSLTVTTPAHAVGSVDVVVTTPAGSGTLTDGYTYVTTVTPGIITGSTSLPGILSGTGLAWLGTAPAAYLVFSCFGPPCDINDDASPPTGPITDTAFNAGPGTWSGYTGAICPAGTVTWDALICTNQFSTP